MIFDKILLKYVDEIKTATFSWKVGAVTNAVQQGVSTSIGGATSGVKKSVDAALHSPYGLKMLSGVNVLLDRADDYVEKYLPDQQENEKSGKGTTCRI